MNEKILEIIDKAHKEGNTSLVIKDEFNELPPEIGKLQNLTHLDIRRCKMKYLPEEIGNLKKLRSLMIRDSNLKVIPISLGRLTNLRMLWLESAPIGKLPSEIKNLVHLEVLNLSDCRLTALPSYIGNFRNLKNLSLGGNDLDTIPPIIFGLDNLEVLNLGNCNIKTLPPSIGNLRKLKVLTLGSTIHGSNEKSRSWAWRSSNSNGISFLPPSIGELSELEILDLSSNSLQSLPDSILKIRKLQELYIHDNEQLKIPPEILGPVWSDVIRGEGSEKPANPYSILQFYFQIHNESTRRLNEAKVILVGQGSVGKTSLVNRLIDGTYNLNERKTEGIQIRNWRIKANKEHIDLNIWDFGGQEIMHATHQFFLTQRSLYLLVLNSREDRIANRVDYWLRMIESYAPDSPVIVVCNKADEQPMDMDWKGLQRKFPSIRAFVKLVSCQNNLGITEVSKQIADEITRMKHVGNYVPDSWFRVKNKLAEMKGVDTDYLSIESYRRICQEFSIDNFDDQDTLLGFLNDLGIMLHYGSHFSLTDLNILNPEWVTNGVYSIINNPELLRRRNGVVTLDSLSKILHSKRYPKGRHHFILSMMQKFELCFVFEGSQGRKFLIPDLLSEEEKDTGIWDDVLEFQYHYDILHGSIITRFIVRMHAFISKNTYWKNGVVIKSENGKNRALISSDENDGIIKILIDGSKGGRRKLLELIRADFRKIHSSPVRHGIKQKIPLPDNKSVTVDYDHLCILEDRGIEEFIPEGTDRNYSVKLLLEGIEDDSQRSFDGMMRNESNNTKFRNPTSTEVEKINLANFWGIGLFWLASFLIVASVISFIANKVSWTVLPIVLISSLIVISLIGILSAHNNGTLSEKGLVKSLKEFYKSLPLLKSKDSDDSSS